MRMNKDGSPDRRYGKAGKIGITEIVELPKRKREKVVGSGAVKGKKHNMRDPDELLELDFKRLQKRVLLELKRKTKDLEGMAIEDLSRVMRICRDNLSSIRAHKAMDQGTGPREISFVTHMAGRGDGKDKGLQSGEQEEEAAEGSELELQADTEAVTGASGE
jgi:hypothetical protein